MFTPGLAIFNLALILRLSLVCGVKSRFLEHSIGRCVAGAWPRRARSRLLPGKAVRPANACLGTQCECCELEVLKAGGEQS